MVVFLLGCYPVYAASGHFIWLTVCAVGLSNYIIVVYRELFSCVFFFLSIYILHLQYSAKVLGRSGENTAN